VKRLGRWLLWASGGLLALLLALLAIGSMRSPDVTARASVEIKRPQAEVWEFLSDLENLPKWSSEVREAKKISDNPRRYRITGMGGSSETELILIEPPRRYVSTMDMPAMSFSGEWDIRIEPAGDSSRVSSEAKMRIGNPLFRALGLFMNADSAEHATLVELKTYLEKQRR